MWAKCCTNLSVGKTESNMGPGMKNCTDAMDARTATTAGDILFLTRWKCFFHYISFFVNKFM